MSRLLTNKYLLIALGFVAVIGLLFISYNASQNSAPPPPAPSQASLQPKSATLPPPVRDHPVSGQIIVKFRPQYTQAQISEHLQLYHASIIKTIEGINQTVVAVPAGQENTIMQKLQTDGYAESTQRDYTTHAFFVPNDPAFPLQYAFKNIGQAIQGKAGKANADMNIESAWDVTQGNGVKVAILDTGINLNHPDLAGKVVLQKSFISNTVEDGNGHGTHVAGIIAADTNNSTGIAGTCPQCQLIIGKVLDDSGSGTTSNATAGITWAADNGAKVINLSLGTTEPSTASLYAQAVNYAMSKGAVVVAAAGNDGSSQLNYPAATTNVISVAATTNIDQKASYSNFGSYVQIAAPGDNVLSTGPTHSFQLQPFGYSFSTPYMYLSGTSMATPYVAGIAALVSTTQFGTTPQAIINRLYATADKINGTGNFWKNGRVDAALAVGTIPTVTPGQQGTIITPTVFCVGGNGTPPCATIPAGVTTAPPQTGGGSPVVSITGPAEGGSVSVNPNVSPSTNEIPSVSSVPSPSGTPNAAAPFCQKIPQIKSVFYNLASNQPQTHSAKIHIKCKPSKEGKGDGGNSNPNNGWLSKFFQLFLQFLQLLLQLITNCLNNPAPGTPLPSISPTQVSGSPSPSVSSSPSVNSPSPATGNGNPTAAPTTAAQPTTPVTTSTCTNPTHVIQKDPNNAQNGVTIGNYYADADTWNAANYQLTQTMYVCNYNNWYVVVNTTDTGDGAIKTYPDVHEDFNEKPISSFTTITSSYADVPPAVGNYDVAYDIWVNGVATSGSTEVMIWTQALGKQASAINSYQSIGTTTIDGVTYNVHKNGNGYIALQAVPYNTSGTVDIKAVFNYLISKNIFPASSTLGAIDYGVEVAGTNGSETFKFTNFSITAN